MAIPVAARIGPYEVLGALGVGAMGEVYRARDTKLERDVALKILPAAFVDDVARRTRFEREAKTLASLNHPHVAQIYGFEQSGRLSALVMELVDGEDLAARIARGPIALDQTLSIARQIADALEAAHERGIVHRDLKPANIMVRADGTVKVLDFGLARALESGEGRQPGKDHPDTLTMPAPALTHAGIILGTAAYMAPEQARGDAVDQRADLWAFGVVLWEMLTAKRPFSGATLSDTLAAVLKSDPPWEALPAATPEPIRRLLRRTLEKDRRKRLAHAGAAGLEIDEASTAPAVDSVEAIAAPTVSLRLAWSVAAMSTVALLAALLAWAPWRTATAPAPPETRLEIVTPDTDDPSSLALSPDGRFIVFHGVEPRSASIGAGGPRLWLRSLADTAAEPLMGTEGASYPFWSPDSRSVAFFADGMLKRVDLKSGASHTIAPAANGRGGAWHEDGTIVFQPAQRGPLMRVSAIGGAVVPATTLGPQQPSHRWPQLLPDDRVLFHSSGPPDVSGIYLGSLDRNTSSRLIPSETAGVYLPAGWLLWVRGTTLLAQHLDLAKGTLTGDPVTVAEGVAGDPLFRSAVSVSATGLVAYRRSVGGRRQLMWVDRSGAVRGTLGEPDGNNLLWASVSLDGRCVAVSRTFQRNWDIWLLDGARMGRLTFGSEDDSAPLCSPDGTRVVFSSRREERWDLYQKLTNNAATDELIVASEQDKIATGWSTDGRFLLYDRSDPQTNEDVWVLPMMGERTPWVFLATPFTEKAGTFSPDGHWVAYQSNESGHMEIYVRRFAPPTATGSGDETLPGKRQVSTTGGMYPTWRPDGKELYYLDLAGAMMAAPVRLTGSTLHVGEPQRLFATRSPGGAAIGRRQYDVAADGRFLINTILDDRASPVTLVMNWRPREP